MTTAEQVYAQAAALAGTLDERQAELLKIMCTGAVNALEGRLKEGLTVEDCREDFVGAASLYALAALGESGEQIREFKAGDLTVKQGGGGDAASRCLRRQAEMILLPYLSDGFAFLGV